MRLLLREVIALRAGVSRNSGLIYSLLFQIAAPQRNAEQLRLTTQLGAQPPPYA